MAHQIITISIAAKMARVGIETVRYYQRVGLITEPKKPDTGYRIYPDETVERIRFIRSAKELGFSLKEITILLELGYGKCSQTRDLAAHKLDLIREKISDLISLEKTLASLVKNCEKNPAHQGCPIITSLSKT